MSPQRKPEPTSFPSAAAEIAHFEKKLEQARADLTARTTFLERMKKQKDDAPISELTAMNQRGKIVQRQLRQGRGSSVGELEQEGRRLKRKQAGG
jgi:ribosomal protein L13E